MLIFCFAMDYKDAEEFSELDLQPNQVSNWLIAANKLLATILKDEYPEDEIIVSLHHPHEHVAKLVNNYRQYYGMAADSADKTLRAA